MSTLTEEQVQILQVYQEQTQNIREALRLSGMPESLIAAQTINLPDLNKMIPEDMTRLYIQFKVMLVIYLKEIGFNPREIASRLGGHTRTFVLQILKDHKHGKHNG